jgi:hypothetical protein
VFVVSSGEGSCAFDGLRTRSLWNNAAAIHRDDLVECAHRSHRLWLYIPGDF